MFIKISADLFRIAYACASTEETRYYLKGVCVQPAIDGVGLLMIATDGHRMIVVRDESATANNLPAGGIIVQADAAQLRAFKTSKEARNRGDVLTLTISPPPENGGRIVGTLNCELREGDVARGSIFLQAVDGSFPEWTRIIPRPEKQSETPGTFNAANLESFAGVALDLAKLRGDRTASMSLMQQDHRSPTLVRFGTSPAFGVLMPLRHEDAQGVPAWMDKRQPLRAVA